MRSLRRSSEVTAQRPVLRCCARRPRPGVELLVPISVHLQREVISPHVAAARRAGEPPSRPNLHKPVGRLSAAAGGRSRCHPSTVSRAGRSHHDAQTHGVDPKGLVLFSVPLSIARLVGATEEGLSCPWVHGPLKDRGVAARGGPALSALLPARASLRPRDSLSGKATRAEADSRTGTG